MAMPLLACVILAGVLIRCVLQRRPMLCCYHWRVPRECVIAIELDHRGIMWPVVCCTWKLNMLSWKENILYFRSKFLFFLEAMMI
jgi:hypothetical protein